jgi:hypothetical protein
MKKQDRLDDIHAVCLVYWYGSDPAQNYGIIKPKEFVPYDEGVQKGLVEKDYHAALRKKDADKQLSKAERELIQGMEELLRDQEMPRGARDRKKADFTEEYEGLYVDEAWTSVAVSAEPKKKRGRPKKASATAADVASEPTALGMEASEAVSSEPVKLKKKRGRPKKSATQDAVSNSATLGVADSDTVAPSAPEEPKKRKRGRPKKSAAPEAASVPSNLDDEAEELKQPPAKRKKGEPSDGGERKAKMRKKNSDVIMKEGVVIKQKERVDDQSVPAAPAAGSTEPLDNVGNIADIGDAEDDESLSDAKDASFDVADEDDSLDDDFVREANDKRPNAKPLNPTQREKPPNKKPLTTKPAKPKSLKETKPLDPMEREKKDYKRCCRDYSSLVEELNQAVLDKSFSAISSSLHAFLNAAEHFSAPFLEHHVAPVVKRTKLLLKEEKRDDILKAVKALNGKLHAIYERKKSLVPPGFKLPKPRKSTLVPTAVKLAPEGSEVDVTVSVKPAEPVPVTEAKPPAAAAESSAASPDRRSSQEMKSQIMRKEQFKRDGPPETTPIPKAPPPKKTFSLGKLGQLIQRDQSQETSQSGHSSQSLPSWLVGPQPNADLPSDVDRILALDFLQGMAQQLPSDRVDVDSASVSLEKALYEWAMSRAPPNGSSATIAGGASKPGKAPWVSLYWERLHALVAGVCGKKDSLGTLANLIVNGTYTTPARLVELSNEDFAKSYNGQPML